MFLRTPQAREEDVTLNKTFLFLSSYRMPQINTHELLYLSAVIALSLVRRNIALTLKKGKQKADERYLIFRPAKQRLKTICNFLQTLQALNNQLKWVTREILYTPYEVHRVWWITSCGAWPSLFCTLYFYILHTSECKLNMRKWEKSEKRATQSTCGINPEHVASFGLSSDSK